MLYSDVVAITSTTAGVSGTITVPTGAKLVCLNISGQLATFVISKVNISWQGLAQPMSFVPNMMALYGTNGAAIGMCNTPLIDLTKLPSVGTQNTVTITITSTGTVTGLEVALMWVAA
jgi:hypothetical protein